MSNGVVLVRGGYYVSGTPHNLTFGRPRPERLSGSSHLSLSLSLYYRIIQTESTTNRWQIVVTSYHFTFFDNQGTEVLAYHWHPDQRSHVNYPHLHLEAGAQVGREDIANAHLTTGRVTLPDVIRMAIAELKVTPRRDDWEAILDEARRAESRFDG